MTVIDLIQAAEALRLRGDPGAAAALYEGFIADQPDEPLIYALQFNLGVLLTDAGALDRARDALEQAIDLNPDFLPAYINLGRVHERQGRSDLAVTLWHRMSERLSPVTGQAITHKVMALNQTARVLEAAHQDEACETALRQSLDLDPTQREAIQHLIAARQRQCAWPVIEPFERVDRARLLKGMSPLSANAYTDDPLLQLALNAHYSDTDVGLSEDGPITRHFAAHQGRSDGRLRIGYMSSDLREHAIGHLMYELPGLHDRQKVEVFAYYCGIPAANDPIHAHYRAAVDQFVDISQMDDATAARRIADDGIQILIDVNGYTRDGRTKLLALRPAPVIVNWLGFPGTLGSPYHHYIIADDWIIPPDSELFYSEAVMRLPCYQPNNRQRVVADHRPTRAEMGLPEDATVFCCFNGTHKITRFTFDRWLDILSRVPDSVLWLLSGSDSSHLRLKAHAQSRGIDPTRIVFAAKLPNPQHLARYPLADLFLDTTPYGAHTTCSDALWMGVPVLTLSGRSFAARVCGSLLRAAGLPELVTTEVADFVDLAVALGRDRARLDGFKARLVQTRDTCTLFDMPGLVRGLEALYVQMWQACRDGSLPRPDLNNLDILLDIVAPRDHEAHETQTIPDYEAHWQRLIAQRHARRPVPFDHRLWRAPQ
ncbi:tetratricopeptide repeat protein [Asticcacaulis sp. BYS171W]|uniref:protein O-GlcNAc transferase n=1 Tax=Asticcacaulis aquaticus TaxID=2984212 RepID=A0ABT5HYG9_9CAUL|nr:tetratricopeptide repeat protein [Asticcacaulis aquaticus]MDC7685126.1 tetratricopeptide repeat protein [Asticcacaulis aquaticus]